MQPLHFSIFFPPPVMSVGSYNIIVDLEKPMTLEVRTVEDLRNAINSGASEIIVIDEKLANQLKALKYVISLGPLVVASVVAAIPFVVATGGIGGAALAAAVPGAAWATSSIIALCIAIGGVIAISLFTDWEYVEMPFGIKLKRRGKS
jgi:hypothetical protein